MANRFLNNITINDEYTLPSVDGTTGQAIVTDGAGNLSFGTVAAGTADAALKITLTVKNVSGGTLSAGTVVRVAPTNNPPSGHVLEVDVADNTAASTMPAIGILTQQILDDAEGDCVAFGRASGFSTSGFTEGDAVYVNASGGFTTTKPTGSDLIQKFGQIIKVHSSNGSIEVFGAGRTNDVPNLSTGKIWVGTATNTAESTLIDVDETNNILTVNGKVYYGNVFSQESDLPSATTYHGMFAHVHGTGYAYYSHAGAWVKLAKLTDINDSTLTVTAGTGLSGGGTFTTNQSSDSAVTVNLDDTAVTPGTYGDANNTPQITIDQQGRITSATTVTTAGSGSGGGAAGELSIERDVITATSNQTVFTISSDITSSSNTQVYIDGVYQAKSNYTTSGSTITFSTGVPAGAEVEVVHFISVLSKVYTDTFTGDASTVDFTASKDVTDENVTQVYIDGVYQSKDNYTTSGTTITFSTAPPSGSAIEVVHFTAATYSTLNSNQFTGTGSQTDFTLTQEVDVDTSFVFVQGVYQEKDTYSISGTTLTFTTAPLSGYSIEIITVGSVSVFSDTLYVDNFNGTGSQVDYTLSTSPASENAIDVYINGLYQQKNTFSLSGSTLTFSTAPPSGSTIEVKSTGGLNNVVTSSGGGGISWQTTPKTANFTAVAGEGYFVNTTSAAITVTLPSSPSAGDELNIVDYAGTAATNSITITSSDNIKGASDDVQIGYERGGVSMVYVDATQGWIAYNAANETATALAPPTVSVDYLVIAGGGSGATLGGGGGAGGYRNSYNNEQSGGGGSSESALTSLSLSTNYTVTIGAGGAATANGAYTINGNNGADSVFASITSVGGGGGGGHSVTNANVGGSGGGGASSGHQTYGAAGTANQGYAGGDNQPTASGYPGGGGGGSGGPGGAGTGGNTSGDGGAGLASSITGSSVTRAGGGGGPGKPSILTPGSGAAGGGSGVSTTPNNGTDATANSGSGGGGGGYVGATSTYYGGGAGGSGIVILRYPNSYTITVPAGLTGSTATDGSDKVTTFTAGTGNISFS